MDVLEFKKRLEFRENIQVHNGDDLAVIGKLKIN